MLLPRWELRVKLPSVRKKRHNPQKGRSSIVCCNSTGSSDGWSHNEPWLWELNMLHPGKPSVWILQPAELPPGKTGTHPWSPLAACWWIWPTHPNWNNNNRPKELNDLLCIITALQLNKSFCLKVQVFYIFIFRSCFCFTFVVSFIYCHHCQGAWCGVLLIKLFISLWRNLVFGLCVLCQWWEAYRRYL